jgi:beta-lactamase class A
MCQTLSRFIFFTVLAFAGLGGVRAAPAAHTYDVSYVWSRDLAAVRDYRQRVAKLLGPAAAEHLEVVARARLFGLVYVRRGDWSGTDRVARAHTRLLESHGLESASPIRSRHWKQVTERRAHDSTPAASANARKSSRRRASSRDRSSEVRDLEVAVEHYIERLRREGKIAPDERTGWSVYDFTTGEKLVTINEDEQFQSASLIKPFIAAAFFYKVKHGKLIYGPRSRRKMRLMIQHSDNAAANWVTRQVGGPAAVERVLKRNYPNIFQETSLVQYIPSDGRAYRNKASAHDYSRFLYAVWKGDIAGAREIKRLMALPGSDRIHTGVRNVPKGTRVYNKTGSTARVCGDMGILSVPGPDGKRYPYTVIGIIEKQQRAANYTTWIRSRANVIRHVSSIVYQGIAQDHDI